MTTAVTIQGPEAGPPASFAAACRELQLIAEELKPAAGKGARHGRHRAAGPPRQPPRRVLPGAHRRREGAARPAAGRAFLGLSMPEDAVRGRSALLGRLARGELRS